MSVSGTYRPPKSPSIPHRPTPSASRRPAWTGVGRKATFGRSSRAARARLVNSATRTGSFRGRSPGTRGPSSRTRRRPRPPGWRGAPPATLAGCEAARQGDRQLARDRRGEPFGGSNTGAARMRTARGIEEKRLGAGVEPGATTRHDRASRSRGVGRVGDGEVENLPGPSRDRSNDADGFVAAELDDVGVDGVHDAFEEGRVGIGGDGDDLWSPRPPPAVRAKRASAAASSMVERPRRPGDDVEPDRLGTCGDGGERRRPRR